jgi:tetratricopeptide (TPR) repeat protein
MKKSRTIGWLSVLTGSLAMAAAGGAICRGHDWDHAAKTTSSDEAANWKRGDEERSEAETQLLKSLAAGEQSKAEEFVEEEVARVPFLKKAIEPVAALEDPRRLARLVSSHAEDLKPKQRTLFLYAACARSRFETEKSVPAFIAVGAIDPDTASGRCAICMLRLDSVLPGPQKLAEVAPAFDALRKLVEEHPRDIMLKWMLAVECRTWSRNAEGAELYKQILEEWDPGPALVHQTYGNLLDELNRHEDALVERQKTIKMEPAGWSYDVLGTTLYDLKRYSESDEAHAMAVRMDPTISYYWSNWAYTLMSEEKFDEAIEKCKRALELDGKNSMALWHWGKALEKQGKLEEALEKYKRFLALAPNEPRTKKRVAELEKKLAE